MVLSLYHCLFLFSLYSYACISLWFLLCSTFDFVNKLHLAAFCLRHESSGVPHNPQPSHQLKFMQTSCKVHNKEHSTTRIWIFVVVVVFILCILDLIFFLWPYLICTVYQSSPYIDVRCNPMTIIRGISAKWVTWQAPAKIYPADWSRVKRKDWRYVKLLGGLSCG